MKILHICIASNYTEGMTYQENILPDQNARDGNEVTVISNCSKFEYGAIVAASPEDKILSNGIRLIRLPYDKIIGSTITNKVRKITPLYQCIQEQAPNVILFHCVCGMEILTVARYKKAHPQVRLYVDSHADANNSAHSWLSLNVLHKIFYKYLLKRALPYIDKLFYISPEGKDFLSENYSVSENEMEFYPLGGIVFDNDAYYEKRARIRTQLELDDDDILLVHSGKLDELKRTEDILKAFAAAPSTKMKLVVIGSIPENMVERLEPLIAEDERVDYVGWKNAEELMDYLCACDMYLQPGSQSATMQNAMCCRCALMLYPHKSHIPYLNENGFYVKTVEDMINVFSEISLHPKQLYEMSNRSLKIAKGMLDYKELAARLYL